MPPLVALALVLILVILFVVVLRIARGMARGAICTVIGTFRMYGAIRPQDALTLRELGLANPRIFEFLRDYRPWAIQTLFQAGIIKPSPSGGFYLSGKEVDNATGIQCNTDLGLKDDIVAQLGLRGQLKNKEQSKNTH